MVGGAEGSPGGAMVHNNVRALLAAWRAGQRPLMHLRDAHDGAGLGLAMSGEAILRRQPANYDDDNALKSRLRREGLNCLVWVGGDAAPVLAPTTGKACMFGFEIYVVSDAIEGVPVACGYDINTRTTRQTLEALAPDHEPSRSSGAY
ncbi:MAG: nicotinamidase-related amidase [Alphaproteobacteria bacterium]|jgi:nicotinamidase-related amidase